jgi:hypothetical protein
VMNGGSRIGDPQDGRGLGGPLAPFESGRNDVITEPPCRRRGRRRFPPTLGRADAKGTRRGRGSAPDGAHGRLWQLPEASIADYARWIVEKPDSEQRPAERRFLWKYLNRMLMGEGGGGRASGVDGPEASSSSAMALSERAKDMMERLEAKPDSERSDIEVQFIRQIYQRRQGARRGQTTARQPQQHDSDDDADPVTISWCRVKNDLHWGAMDGYSSATGIPPRGSTASRHLTTLASLRESMTRLGLSADTLRHEDISQTMDQDG